MDHLVNIEEINEIKDNLIELKKYLEELKIETTENIEEVNNRMTIKNNLTATINNLIMYLDLYSKTEKFTPSNIFYVKQCIIGINNVINIMYKSKLFDDESSKNISTNLNKLLQNSKKQFEEEINDFINPKNFSM